MIRKIKKKDYAAVERLLQQLHQVHMNGRPELFFSKEYVHSEHTFEALISNKEVISILAEEDKEVVGVCFVSMMGTSGMVRMKTAYINELVVDEPYRRRGIGEALFKEAERRAKKMGAKRIDLMVWSFNEDAIHAYETYGMIPQRYIYEKKIDESINLY